MRPWNSIEIDECGEPLLPFFEEFLCLEPHPYLSLGAPYGENMHPWYLRSGVIDRLLIAQKYLSFDSSGLQLAVFDSWRPIPVQAFMVKYSIDEQCSKRGIKVEDENYTERLQEVIDDVNRFWAVPTLDPLSPPPHSTGAAIDLTLADELGNPLDMGGEIDFIGDASLPNYFQFVPTLNRSANELLFNFRRSLLYKCMNKAGFSQHPNEWWHFSYGDQLWGWVNNSQKAIYGGVSIDNNEETL